MSGLLSPAEIRKQAEDRERAKLREAMEEMKKKQSHEEDVHKAFMERDLRPDWQERLNRAIAAAVERGQNEVMVVRFPAEWCTDKGRAINNFEAGWPSTLTGFAERAYGVFKSDLEPMGYQLKAQVLSFPGGMPGEVGIFLVW